MKKIDVKQIERSDWPYKADDAEMQAKLAGNIERNGLVAPLVAYRRKGETTVRIVDGNHRLEVLKRSGLPVTIAERDEMPEVLFVGEMDDHAAKRLAVEINETRFASDQAALAKLIGTISDHYDLGDLIETMPFDEDELAGYVKLGDLDFAPPEAPARKSEPIDDDTEWKTVRVRVPRAVKDIFDAEMDRLKQLTGSDKDCVALEAMIMNSANTPAESMG
jgi:ParB-like chromosome segregation protein Spo0J